MATATERAIKRAQHRERVAALREQIGDPIEALRRWREDAFPDGVTIPDGMDVVEWCSLDDRDYRKEP